MSVSTVSQAGAEGLHAAVKDESIARRKYGPKAQRRSEERQSCDEVMKQGRVYRTFTGHN
jgi:hypothetical protein